MQVVNAKILVQLVWIAHNQDQLCPLSVSSQDFGENFQILQMFIDVQNLMQRAKAVIAQLLNVD